jgi:hypothetical protein
MNPGVADPATVETTHFLEGTGAGFGVVEFLRHPANKGRKLRKKKMYLTLRIVFFIIRKPIWH